MGQTITATARAGTSPDVRFFDLNHSLTGMEIERYTGAADATAKGMRPPDVLAHRLLEAGATLVTIYSNVVTVEAPAASWATLEPKALHLIEHLFEYYGDEAGWSYEARGLEAPPPVDLAG
ncbi:MAG: hypothetical protein ACXV8Y_12720 [Acidimicrobiia bacterium]